MFSQCETNSAWVVSLKKNSVARTLWHTIFETALCRIVCAHRCSTSRLIKRKLIKMRFYLNKFIRATTMLKREIWLLPKICKFYKKELRDVFLDHEGVVLRSRCMGDSWKWLCGTSKSDDTQCLHTSSEGCLERSKREGWKYNVLHTSRHAWEHTPKGWINKESQGRMWHITNLLLRYGKNKHFKTTNS